MSRGTETLVFRGGVPESQHASMRAPFQDGDFPAPVKYGYLSVGQVEEGPARLLGRTVFCLYPHQTRYVVPVSAVTVVPDSVPAARAVLAGTVETAVNALWDAAPLVGDRIAVVGGGMVGCSVAALLARFPGVRIQLVDADPARAEIARALGVDFALPADAADECDLVVHASATEAGLTRSLELLAQEGTVLEMSWYGDRRVSLPLGRPSTQGAWWCAAARWVPFPRRGAPAGRTPTGWRSPSNCSPSPPSTRSSPVSAASTNCPTCCRSWLPDRYPGCAIASSTTTFEH